jgi:hypothetical protein
MSTFWMIFGYGFLIFLAFQAGRSADAARERHLRRQTAEEVRRLAEERRRLEVERERYHEFVQRRRRERAQRPDDDVPPGGAPPIAA